MRRTKRSNATRWLMRFGAPLAAAWLVAACGQDPLPAQEDEVLALDLQSGERRRFKSPQEVPPGWGVCADDACTIPPSIPCERLGLRLCVDQPNCKARLVCELDFGDGPVAVPEPFALRDGDDPLSRDDSAEESIDCKMTCATRAPSSCEAAADEQTCLGMSSTRCEWVPVGPCILPATRCGGGTRCLPPMPPPECPMACRAAAPLPPPPPPPPVDPCQKVTDQRRCLADAACEWIPGGVSCLACLGPDCKCLPPPPGSGECRSKSPAPPPPPVDLCKKVIDQRRCLADPACEWFSGPVICPACLGPGCECRPPAPGSGECRSKSKPDCARCPDCCDPPTPAPKCFVGGCSGEICSDKPGQVSVCIFPPPGGLPPRGAVCGRQTDGTCGWSIPAVD